MRDGRDFSGDASRCFRLPSHRAGFSPWPRFLFAFAKSSTVSIRPRTRFAVSVFSCQIGLITFRT